MVTNCRSYTERARELFQRRDQALVTFEPKIDLNSSVHTSIHHLWTRHQKHFDELKPHNAESVGRRGNALQSLRVFAISFTQRHDLETSPKIL